MFIIKQYNTIPNLQATLLDPDGAPVNLTGATVRFSMRSRDTDQVVVSGLATVLDAPNGQVAYGWLPADTTAPGAYYGEFFVTYTGGGRESFPNSNYIEINVVKSAGNAP